MTKFRVLRSAGGRGFDRKVRALVAAAALACIGVAAVPAAAQQTGYDFCTQFADRTISVFFRMQQAKCGAYQKLNMNWRVHYDWCLKEGVQKSLANLASKDQALGRCP